MRIKWKGDVKSGHTVGRASIKIEKLKGRLYNGQLLILAGTLLLEI